MRRPGSWASWSWTRRRLVILTVVNWMAVAVVAAVGMALNEVLVLLGGFPLLALDLAVSLKLVDVESREGADADLAAEPPTPEEQELLDELSTTTGREADLLIVQRWLGIGCCAGTSTRRASCSSCAASQRRSSSPESRSRC